MNKISERGADQHKDLIHPPTLNTNLSASGESLISSPSFSHSTVGRDVNIYFVKKDVSQRMQPVPRPLSKGCKSLTQEASADSDVLSKVTPKKVKRKPQTIFQHNRNSLHSAGRLNVTQGKVPFDDVTDEPDVAPLDEGSRVEAKCIAAPGGRVLTNVIGEVTGSRVTADYHCYECRSAVPHFEPNAFTVKCTECEYSWKCARVECTCTAKMTIELSDGRKRTVVLSDSLLRSIVTFNTHGYCDTDIIEKRVLKVGSVRVDFKNGCPVRVQTITSNQSLMFQHGR